MTLNYKQRLRREFINVFPKVLEIQGEGYGQEVDEMFEWFFSHLPEVSGEWEEEFYEKFGIPGTSVFSFTNAESFFVIKGFISSLLSQKQAEIITLIEGVKINSRKLDPNRNKKTIDRVRGYNSAIRDILKAIKK